MAELGEHSRRFLKALAGETRQQLMEAFSGNAELTVGQVAERAGIAQSTASEHLAMLREGGLLTARRDGKTVYYRANPAGIAAALTELQGYLAVCCPPTE
ncbi:DNA-binding transcriptional ArsR family regulator [Saccharothrix ecbatanensis]|uniref:DNA-binding transcriptional ArsR family regulator n=1 Tax=Saccharothrix ecbatanensis TaxID=1105145 RepID=A0A7W9HP21_9PSEU|nr:metalloregulator ArsR/SmtB family transcription factor [Saccharothrix ecbatanensis]MBB5805670.1 DNA-binding transcriptional ArsR family regulator [Saccharothrix ecbatanensis]